MQIYIGYESILVSYIEYILYGRRREVFRYTVYIYSFIVYVYC